MRIERASGKCPGSTAMCPCGAKLQQNRCRLGVGAHQEKSCCAVKTPVDLPAIAAHPAIAVPKTHAQDVGTPVRAGACCGCSCANRAPEVVYLGDMDVQRVTGVFGATICIDDVRTLTDSDFAELRALVCEHEMVVIPGQSLTALEQVEFSHRFGPAAESPFIEPSPDHPEVIKVLKEAQDGQAFNFGGAWHSDFSFLANPPSFTVLHAIDIPPYGGDTLWSSMTAAWNALSPEKKSELEQIWAVHTARDAYSPKMQAIHSGLSAMNIVCDESANDTQLHPLVTTHPETGKKVLFYNRAYVRDLVGFDDVDQKTKLLEWLHVHTTDARFTLRHRWTAGDLVIWDNRSTQHYALNDYAGFRRELHRTTIAGAVPVA